MSSSEVPLKDYIDALNEEQRRTGNMRSLAIVGTFGALIYGILQATRVLANTFEKRMDTTNEWRGALEDQAKDKATVQQVENLEKQVGKIEEKVNDSGSQKQGGAQLIKQAALIIGAVAAINGVIYLVGGG